ncbi:DDE-type integrase/transposase/recombinase [Pseudomonas sp. REP124]|uniref:DDE-type integrase/transposase/recombinase n=1 Tax=Pseudomonas sp. REP124 TaxID=2875731 RepID=UPI001CCB400D|nr:DDE-type integrase/transposase/recombinase [Pseudomonas sp. REP124]MBZ9783624.1 DDE-type integrase/transposase/recombinase [Pseudomonas sp. REP124]
MLRVDSIRAGERYHYCGKDYQVMEVDDQRVQLRSVYGPPQVVYQYRAMLNRAAAQGKFIKVQEAPIETDANKIIARLPKKEARQLEVRFAYVHAVLNARTGSVTRKTFPDLIEKMVEELGPHKAPCYTTLWDWKRAYLCAGNNCVALLPNTFRPINKHISHQPREVQELIKFNIATYYWTKTPFSKTGLIGSIRLMLEHLNLRRAENEQFRIPSESTLYRIICEIDSHETIRHQCGAKAAKKLHYWGASTPEPDRLFELVEADTRQLDIFLVNENGKSIGKPILTLFIEVKTRYIIAWHISFNPASLDTTEIALKKSMSLDNPHGGVAELYVFDNGPEWIANALRKVLWLLGAEVSYCQPGEPDEKSHVEAVFKTWATEIEHRMRGTTFQNSKVSARYDAEGNAIYTLEDVRTLFSEFLDIYHADEHSTLGMSPNEAWSAALSQQFKPHRYSEQDLRRAFWRSAEVTPHSSGRVRHDNLLWWGPAVSYLAELRPKVKKLLLYFDPCDVGNAWLCHPLHPLEIQPLNPLHPEYQNGLTLDFHHKIWAQRKAVRKARSRCTTAEAKTQLLWKIAHANATRQPLPQPLMLEHDLTDFEQLMAAQSPPATVARPRVTQPEYNPNTPADFTVSKGHH